MSRLNWFILLSALAAGLLLGWVFPPDPIYKGVSNAVETQR